jgi:hypothetical protein
MSDTSSARRQPALYWEQLSGLKTASVYSRLYRDRQAGWVQLVELVKAFASSGAIAGWVVWRDLPLLWSGIIAMSQFLDATKHVFPFARRQKSASDLTVALELLCIDAEAEWENIYAGTIPNERIIARWARLAKLLLQALHKHFPDGFPQDEGLKARASREASEYLSTTYGEGPPQ